MNNQTLKFLYITGGTGFIGSALAQRWLSLSNENAVIIQTRRTTLEPGLRTRYVQQYDQLDADLDIVGIVNLAGAPIADARWTEKRKRTLEGSRVNLTKDLFRQVSARSAIPPVVINASAIGYYGLGENAVGEASPHGAGYAAQLCEAWEEQAMAFEQVSRLVILRLGVVLGDGGVLKRLSPVFRMGMGGPIASGEQWFSWVHLHDVVNVIINAMQNSSWSGVFNVTSPQPVPQKLFAKTLASVLHRPAVVPTPALALELMFGDMAKELLIGGQKVLPKRLLEESYEFSFPSLEEALSDAIA